MRIKLRAEEVATKGIAEAQPRVTVQSRRGHAGEAGHWAEQISRARELGHARMPFLVHTTL